MKSTHLCALLLLWCLVPSTARAAALQDAPTLSGRVVDVSGLPVPGVTVTVTSMAGTEAARMVTPPDGRFEIAALASGAYRARFALTGFRTEVRFLLMAAGSSRELRITLQVDRDAVFVGRPEPPGFQVDAAASAVIAGRVSGPNGVGWPGLLVRVRRLGPGSPQEVRADQRGEFRLAVVPGTYRIVLGAASEFRPHVLDEVIVADGATVDVSGRVDAATPFEFGGGLAPGAGEAVLRIRVLDEAGVPLAAAELTVPDEPGVEPLRTNAMGERTMVLPEGRHTLRASVPGFETRTVSPVRLVAGSTTESEVRLRLEARYR